MFSFKWYIFKLCFSFLNNLCIGLDGAGNVVMKESDDGDNSQFWAWNDDNDSLRNKDGMALDVCGGDDDAGKEFNIQTWEWIHLGNAKY